MKTNPLFSTCRLAALTLVTLSLLLTGCQTPPLDVQYRIDDNFDSKQHLTFSVHTKHESNPDYIEFISKGIEKVLIEKGYQPSNKADIHIVYEIDIDQGTKVKTEAIPVRGQLYNRMTLEAVLEAKILVNAFEKRSGKVIWKASSSRDLTNVNTNRFDQDRANLRMAELFASFPAR